MQYVNPIINLHCYDITLAGNRFFSGQFICIAAFTFPCHSFPAATWSISIVPWNYAFQNPLGIQSLNMFSCSSYWATSHFSQNASLALKSSIKIKIVNNGRRPTYVYWYSRKRAEMEAASYNYFRLKILDNKKDQGSKGQEGQ